MTFGRCSRVDPCGITGTPGSPGGWGVFSGSQSLDPVPVPEKAGSGGHSPSLALFSASSVFSRKASGGAAVDGSAPGQIDGQTVSLARETASGDFPSCEGRAVGAVNTAPHTDAVARYSASLAASPVPPWALAAAVERTWNE